MRIAVTTTAPHYWLPQAECFAEALRLRGNDAFTVTPATCKQPRYGKCDLLLCIGSGESPRPMLDTIDATRKILYLIESLPTETESDSFTQSKLGAYRNCIGEFGCVFVHTPRSIHAIQQVGLSRVEALMWPGFPAIFFPVAEIKKDIDILFVGAMSKHREAVLSLASQRHVVTHTQGAFHAQCAALYRRAKIVLNIHFTELPHFECRLIEALGCGAFVLTERLDPANWLIDGQHIVTFDANTLPEALDHYLNSDDERSRIATAGHGVVQECSLDKQLDRLLAVAAELPRCGPILLPLTLEKALAAGIQHHQAGRLQVAEKLYQRILTTAPDHVDALHLLGVISLQTQRHELAIDYITRAIELNDDRSAFHTTLGAVYRALGRTVKAVTCYRRALELTPHFAEAHNNLGNALNDENSLDEAISCYRRALEFRPDYATAHYNLGNALRKQGNLDEAVDCYRQALELKPDYADAHNNLGNLFQGQGKPDQAIACYRRALELKPACAEAHNNLGILLRDHGKLDDAVACHRRALELNPAFAEAHNNLGIALRVQGKLNEAVTHCRRALELEPAFADAHNNLGIALRAQGQLDEAVTCYRRALQLKPAFAEAHNNLGNALNEENSLDEAISCYHRALECNPDYAVAHYNLGNALREQGNLDEAVDCYRRALELKPDYADAHNNLGNLFQGQGEPDQAVACYRRVLELKPTCAEAHNNLGIALWDQGRVRDAVACYRQALELKPAFAEAHVTLGNALRHQGKLDAAVACYRRALELKPAFSEAHNNLGIALWGQGKLDEAVTYFRRALELKPTYAEALNNLGITLRDQGKLNEAVACYCRALELKPNYAAAHYNLGNGLRKHGNLDEAIACYRRALELKPDYVAALASLVHELQHLCRWDGLDILAERVIKAVDHLPDHELNHVIAPFSFFALPLATTAEQQLKCARHWVQQQLNGVMEQGPAKAEAPAKAQKAKTIVGYLSADFHSHATAFLLAELLEKHDRCQFTVIGYSYGPDDETPMRRRLTRAFDHFLDVRSLSFQQAARRITADGVQILVDLKGHTADARTEILALRPAPIQVNYLGYPGTMGASFIDYILVDDYVVPADQQPYFSEKLVHLPGCYQVNDSQREIAPRTPSRHECGLPEEGFVFCSFNNSYKITPEMFGVWMELLKTVPGSVLWLLEGNRFAPANLRREAELRGVKGERLIFAPRMPLAAHLARHRLADLFLDTFPVNAHTTASDALWAGLPVLTLAGETFASRVAGSLLRAVELPELITTSLDKYRELALHLAQDAVLLAKLRARLEANRKISRLFDAGHFARNLEKAYSTMCEIHESGEAPRSFAVDPT